MWDQYKRNFVGTQLVILVITGSVFARTGRVLGPALVFFAMMQVGAVAGAAWGTRLKRKLQQRAW